jgi:hypothetical protein
VLYRRKIAFQPSQQLGLRASLKHLGEKGTALVQNFAGKIGSKLDQPDDAQMIGLLVTRRVGSHVR